MKTWQKFLAEKDEYSPLHTGRNSFFQPQPPYQDPHGVTWRAPDKGVQLLRSPTDKNKMFVIAEKPNLRLDAGEWWARAEEVVWDGASLKKTGFVTNIPIAAMDKVNGASLVDKESLMK